MSLKERQRTDLSSIKRILLIRLRRMGDILMTTPAARVLRDALPEAHISYLVEEPFKDLVEGSPLFNEVIVFPKKMGNLSFLKKAYEIRKKRPHAVIDFHCGPRASLLTLFSGARIKIGYDVRYKSIIYNRRIPRSPEKGEIHSVENHLNLVRALGIEAEPSRLEMPGATRDEEKRLRRLFKERELNKGIMIVLHIGSGNEFRQWGFNNFNQFIQFTSQKKDIRIVLVGEHEDMPMGKKLLKANSQHTTSLVGELNLRELRWVISESQLFVGADSGPMHVAATTSTPIVALFGPTVPANFSPWRAKAVLIEKNLDCRPCKQRDCLHDDLRCIKEIRPQEVFETALALLEES